MSALPDIEARYRDCLTYNFGMRNADKLAHEDVPFLLAELRKAREALTDAGAKALEEAADAVAAQRDASNPDRTPDEAWSVIDHRDGRFFGKTVAVRLLRARAKALRAAVDAAKGDGE